jgi:hypothetical protein
VSREHGQGQSGDPASGQVLTAAAPRNGVRADFLLSGTFLASLGLLLLNDFVLKPFFPGPVSGILSDLAGMVFFPVFLVGIAELVAWTVPGRPLARPSWFVASTVFVAASFLVVKYTTIGHDFYAETLQPVAGLIAPVDLGTVGASSDPWDLLALLLTPLPIWLGRRYRMGGPNPAPSP